MYNPLPMQPFKLDCDLIFFDLETTGINVLRDRIVQIAMVKFSPGKDAPEDFYSLIDPGMPIPPEVIRIHGIDDEAVAGAPSFSDLADEMYAFIGRADLAGYNSIRFDVPLLAEEFFRCGIDIDLESRRLVDVQRIFYKMEPRSLKAAYQFYCGKILGDAHDAMADTRATVEVLLGQMERYRNTDYVDDDGKVTERPVRNEVQALSEFTNDLNTLDVTQRLRLNERSEVVFNFGKYVNQRFEEVWQKEPTYFSWILERDFSYQVKKIVRRFVEEKKQNKA
jgi:DNA polymerase-3 subunit epsilon